MVNVRLDGRVAIVFGAGSSGPGWGNGKAAAVAYARQGAAVCCVDIDEEAAAETAGIVTDEGGKAIAVTCDVTKLADVERAVAETLAKLSAVDILHNNVGHAGMGGPVELAESDWLREIDVNLNSMYRTTKAVLPIMLDQRHGVIINISSVAGARYVGYPYASYYAAKGGVNQFTIGLALQYARQGIRVNAILPGLMDTPLIRTQISGQYASQSEMMERRHEASPTGRMGTAWDVANAAVFLASDAASYITGVLLPVDGGFMARAG